MRMGLLAYGAIGHEHNLAIGATAGLELTAVCDTNSERVAAALELAPDAATFADATKMLDSGLIDAVVISTPPTRTTTGRRRRSPARSTSSWRSRWHLPWRSATS